MKRKELAICDKEQDYTLRFAEYANGHREPLFTVHGFTSLEELIEDEKERPADILLLSQAMLDEVQKNELAGQIICLTEEEYQEEELECPMIYKYQSCPQILRKAFSIYAERVPQSLGAAVKLGSLRRIGIFSPLGRVGKTSLALALGRELTKQKRTLYLNMEEFSGFPALYPHEEGFTLSELMYFLKQGKKAFACKLESIVRQIGGLDYLPPVRSPLELWDIQGEDWARLLAALEKESRYEFLLMDLGSSVKGLFELLEACDKIYMPLTRDETARGKLKQYEDTLELLGLEELSARTEKLFLKDITELEAYAKAEGRRWAGE